VYDLDPIVERAARVRELGLEAPGIADEHDLDRVRSHRSHRARDLGARRAVTSHRIDDDPHGRVDLAHDARLTPRRSA
jgi:hypothetical protein